MFFDCFSIKKSDSSESVGCKKDSYHDQGQKNSRQKPRDVISVRRDIKKSEETLKTFPRGLGGYFQGKTDIRVGVSDEEGRAALLD